MAEDFNPEEKSAGEVRAHLEEADAEERARIAASERKGRKRKTVLEAAGVDPDARVDATGRTLYPWEVAPEKQAFHVRVDEEPEARKQREAQAELDQAVVDEQGDTPADA